MGVRDSSLGEGTEPAPGTWGELGVSEHLNMLWAGRGPERSREGQGRRPEQNHEGCPCPWRTIHSEPLTHTGPCPHTLGMGSPDPHILAKFAKKRYFVFFLKGALKVGRLQRWVHTSPGSTPALELTLKPFLEAEALRVKGDPTADCSVARSASVEGTATQNTACHGDTHGPTWRVTSKEKVKLGS